MANDAMVDAQLASGRNLILLSNSRNEGQQFLEHASASVAELFGEAGTILLVPYASPPDASAIARTHGFFGELGLGTELCLDGLDAAAQVDRAEGIFILGGNTFRLLRRLYENDLIAPLRAAAAAGTPMMGASAGSNVMCPTISTTNDMPIVEPPSFAALELISFQVNTHFIPSELFIDDFTGENRQERLEEFVQETGRPVLALREGSGLRVQGEAFRLIGEKPAPLFSAGESVIEVQPGRLDGLVLDRLQT
jgi:dipeptidase E